jgi:hypothetical protein
LKALLAPKKQFGGPKSRLEYLEGTAGPKRQFERPKPCLEYLEGAAGPKREIQDNFNRKILSKEQISLIRRTSFETFSKRQSRRKKLCVCLGNTKERGTKTLKESQSKGHPSARGTYLRDSKEFLPIFAL